MNEVVALALVVDAVGPQIRAFEVGGPRRTRPAAAFARRILAREAPVRGFSVAPDEVEALEGDLAEDAVQDPDGDVSVEVSARGPGNEKAPG